MSKYRYEMGGIIRDTEIDFPYYTDEIIELLNEKDQQIADLEAKLAENKKKKEDFKTMYFNKCLDYEHLHEKFDDKCTEFELKEYDYKQTIFEKEQDKISFAVEQLEKVKEFFLEEHRDEEMDTDYIITKDAGQIADYLLDQIKLLKEGK